MKPMFGTIALCGLLLGALATNAFGADDKQPADPKKQSVRAKEDAVCTKCHDENDNKPILALYQSRHGVVADMRTPSCQGCHGQSEAHVKNTAGSSTRPVPDVVFAGKKKSDAKTQSGACLACHQSGLRTHWSGSQHQANDVACANCHASHAPKDAMVTKGLQPPVCFTCHKEQRADTYKISSQPIDAGRWAARIATIPMVRRARRCSRRTRSRKRAGVATRRSAARSFGSISRPPRTAPSAISRMVRISRHC